jgi:hypothetical protein
MYTNSAVARAGGGGGRRHQGGVVDRRRGGPDLLDEELRRLQVGTKLLRQDQRGAVDQLGGRDGAILLGGGSESKKDPRQVLRPGGTRQAGLQGVL